VCKRPEAYRRLLRFDWLPRSQTDSCNGRRDVFFSEILTVGKALA
jgi:hypothetical protein